MNRLVLPAAAAALTLLALAGCSSQGSDLANDYKQNAGKNYVSSDGTTKIVSADSRGDAIDFSGTDDAGEKVSGKALVGKVVVVNFWYASCPPCRAEAPELEKLYQEYSPKDVVFVGVNVRDTKATALTFEKKYGISYASIMDAEDSAVQLAFAGTIQPNAVPSTLVLDKQGRVAARFSGLITSPTTVGDVLDDALAEDS